MIQRIWYGWTDPVDADRYERWRTTTARPPTFHRWTARGNWSAYRLT